MFLLLHDFSFFIQIIMVALLLLTVLFLSHPFCFRLLLAFFVEPFLLLSLLSRCLLEILASYLLHAESLDLCSLSMDEREVQPRNVPFLRTAADDVNLTRDPSYSILLQDLMDSGNG